MKLPQLALRELFWLMLVVGFGLGWWMDHRRIETNSERLTAALVRLYETALPGKLLEDVVREQHLDQFQVWATPDLPPGSDSESTHFLDAGNLTLLSSGHPAKVTQAQFQPSDQSAAERYQAVTGGWSEWMERHSD